MSSFRLSSYGAFIDEMLPPSDAYHWEGGSIYSYGRNFVTPCIDPGIYSFYCDCILIQLPVSHLIYEDFKIVRIG